MKFTLSLRHTCSLGRSNVITQHRHSTSTATTLPPPRIDYKSIAENVQYKSHNALTRKAALPPGTVESVARLYEEMKTLSGELNQKLAWRKKMTIPDVVQLAQARTLKMEIAKLQTRLDAVETELLRVGGMVPNDTHPDAPVGGAAPRTIAVYGPSEQVPAAPARDHVRVARALDILDLEAATTVTGSSWYYLTNEAALLELALVNYAVAVALRHGYTPVATPDVVKADVATRCGFQPRDDVVQQMYHVTPDGKENHHHQLVLSGTAEIPLAGMFANAVLEESSLPRKVVGVGRAFRAEAGARGADTRGLYRVHQFSKVELFAVTAAGAESEGIMEDMLKVQVEILSGLGLSLRVLDMPAEELGASAYRKYDIEAWMPGRGSWGEVTSLSNCTDYQSRRLHIRYRPRARPANTPLPFAHTLNGTAAAIPRLIVALLENGVRFRGGEEEGEIEGLNLPRVLRPFWMVVTGGEEGGTKINWV